MRSRRSPARIPRASVTKDRDKARKGRGGGTYDAGVADEVVEPGGPEDGLELRGERADVVEVGHVELHEVQRALRAALQLRECGGFLGRAARGDDEVAGDGEQLADDLEADAAVRAAGRWLARVEVGERERQGAYPVTSQVVGDMVC